MEIYQLRYFVEIARSESMTRAARSLNLAQPALSQQIRKLEEEFQTRLFTRGTRRLTLTDAGRVLLEHAQIILRQADVARNAMEELSELKRGRLVIATIPTIGACWLPERLRRFCIEFPEIEVVLKEGSSSEVLAAVESGDADIGFAQHPVKSQRMVVSKLLVDRLVLLVARDHPLAGRRSLKLRQMRDERFIFYKGRVRELSLAACRAADFEPGVVCQSEELQTIKALVAARMGIALVPEMAVSREETHLGSVALTDRGLERTIVRLHYKPELLCAAARAFLDASDRR